MPTSDEICAQHLREVSIHEVCHAFTALPRSAGVMLTLNRNLLYSILPNQKMWDGRVKVSFLDDDKYQDSVYGWAGIVGEAIEQDRAKAVALAWERYHNKRETVSDTDLTSIECVAETLRPKSAQSACDLLLGKWAEIKDLQTRAIAFIEERKLTTFVTGWMKPDGWFPIE